MKTAIIRPTIKRHRDLFSDHYDLPLKRSCRDEGIIDGHVFNESPRHSPTFCKLLTVRNLDGVEKSLDLDDFVDMVMQVTKNLDEADLAQQLLHISKRRQQNKMAAARYRDKQKERKHILLKEQAELEEKNAKLKKIVSELEREVTEYKEKLVQIMSDLSFTRI
ncbi:unnamed protein product [Cylicocyclus nassatus]|uniref:BZIP domain-containing protein n=1 Tax=Cylicocyclus nassatus TaxID=53992 RepID=A0AA36M9V8_CYLNA|nr:unnamed protein product [Cylicocyclus nassatus]